MPALRSQSRAGKASHNDGQLCSSQTSITSASTVNQDRAGFGVYDLGCRVQGLRGLG